MNRFKTFLALKILLLTTSVLFFWVILRYVWTTGVSFDSVFSVVVSISRISPEGVFCVVESSASTVVQLMPSVRVAAKASLIGVFIKNP